MAGTTTKSRVTQRAGSDMRDLTIAHNLLMEDFKNIALQSPAPVIKTGGSALAKTGATTTFLRRGDTLYSIAASTDLPALTGINFTTGQFVLVVFATDGTTVSAFGGTPAASQAAALWPAVTAGLTAFAGLLITYAGTFTGGTTPLDTATTVYFPIIGPWHGTMSAYRIGNLAGTVITS